MNQKYLVILIAGLAVYFLNSLLIMLFISFLLTAAYLPVVRWLKSKNIPRSVSSAILVIALLVIPAALLVNLSPIIVEQGSSFIQEIPESIEVVEQRFGISISQEFQGYFTDNGEQLLTDFLSITGTIFTFFASTIIILVLTIYWLIYYEEIKSGLVKIFSTDKKRQKRAEKVMTAVETRLGTWVKAQLLISAVVGLMTWIVLSIIGLPYAGVLAIVAALLEIIPSLGPILAAIPALLLAVTISPTMFIVILITYIAIQQIESYVIGPRLLSHTLKLNPFVILLSLITGAHLLGIVGALIAVPAVLTGNELYRAYVDTPKPKGKRE
jgi:predicted PurR-regulated permease PerM